MYGCDLSRPPHNPETDAINRTPTEKVFTLFNRLNGIEGSAKVAYPLSLWERVGVRASGCSVRAGVSLILAFSQREKEQDNRLSQNLL